MKIMLVGILLNSIFVMMFSIEKIAEEIWLLYTIYFSLYV